jgi:hypothetical protein
VGFTLVEPLAEVDVKVPGVMARLVAPLVTQASELLEPVVIPVGFAVKEVIVGLLGGVMVTDAVAVTDPWVLVAVSV